MSSYAFSSLIEGQLRCSFDRCCYKLFHFMKSNKVLSRSKITPLIGVFLLMSFDTSEGCLFHRFFEQQSRQSLSLCASSKYLFARVLLPFPNSDTPHSYQPPPNLFEALYALGSFTSIIPFLQKISSCS